MPEQQLVKLTWRDRWRGSAAVTQQQRKGWGSWIPLIRESFSGAWQRNVQVSATTVASNWAVFACVTLIANDIGKMPAYVMRFNEATGVWERVIKRRVLDIPNTFQVWTDFVRSWLFSLLLTGNTYVLRVLDRDGFISALFVLDPRSVKPLVTPGGEVYYQVSADNLSGVTEAITVPASQIIHDRINTFWHPLCGISPLWASGVAAAQGLAMQENSASFFQNMSRPGGVLTAPGPISDEAAQRLKAYWETEFAGEAAGKIAVAGDGLKFEPLSMTAVDSQLIEQLKFTGEMICATFHVPPYKLGIGAPPSVGNIAALNQQYYDQCLHPLVEAMERRLDIGLEIAYPEQIWFDTAELLRMDPTARWDAHVKKISSGAVAPDEVRREENLPPVEGGATPYLQQQNYSLADLARRSKIDAAKAETVEQAGADAQIMAMGGTLAASLLQLLSAAAADQIPVDSARAAIAAAFPNLTDAQLDAIIDPLEELSPPPAPPAAPDVTEPPPPSAEPGDEEDDEEDAEVELAFAKLKNSLLELSPP